MQGGQLCYTVGRIVLAETFIRIEETAMYKNIIFDWAVSWWISTPKTYLVDRFWNAEGRGAGLRADFWK